jgi:hypothetical protein
VTQPEDPKQAPKPAPDDDSPDAIMRTLFRVTRTFLVPFLLSWAVAYVGGQRGVDWLYYTGLGGVGVSVIGLLLWLLHH